eukprot:3250264-Prymnesium_polylepis.2
MCIRDSYRVLRWRRPTGAARARAPAAARARRGAARRVPGPRADCQARPRSDVGSDALGAAARARGGQDGRSRRWGAGPSTLPTRAPSASASRRSRRTGCTGRSTRSAASST